MNVTKMYDGKYKGYRIIITRHRIEIPMPYDDGSEWLCGYVQLKDKDYYAAYLNEAEMNLYVFGGVTYVQDKGDYPVMPEMIGGLWVGFDTNHWNAPKFTVEMAKGECMSMINQIRKKNSEKNNMEVDLSNGSQELSAL